MVLRVGGRFLYPWRRRNLSWEKCLKLDQYVPIWRLEDALMQLEHLFTDEQKTIREMLREFRDFYFDIQLPF